MAIIIDSETGEINRVPETAEQIYSIVAETYELDPLEQDQIDEAIYLRGWTIFDDEDIKQTTTKEIL